MINLYRDIQMNLDVLDHSYGSEVKASLGNSFDFLKLKTQNNINSSVSDVNEVS